MNIRKYIPSFRLRTLPLSVAGIVLGTGLAYPAIRWSVAILAVITTLCLQILANLANELGDAQRGTDLQQGGRVAYGLQSGRITEKEIRQCIWCFVGLSIVFGSALVGVAFGTLFSTEALLFLALGGLAIIGAITYTLGSHPYGYHRLGDLGVFLFFGLLSTMGAYYLQTQTLTAEVACAAIGISCPIIGVLNLNNIRDISNDQQHGKHTLAAALGSTGAKIYQSILLVGCMVIFCVIGHWWSLVVLPVYVHHIIYLFRHDGHELDRLLPLLSLSTLVLAVVACF